jgi:hypothetical protein
MPDAIAAWVVRRVLIAFEGYEKADRGETWLKRAPHGRPALLTYGLKQIISEVCAETDTDLLEMEIMPDHVHLLVECDTTFGINRLIRSIKGRSSED